LSSSAARARAAEDDKALLEAGGYARQLGFVRKWTRPDFPLKGADLTALGIAPGPTLGTLLRRLEQEWIASGFMLGRDALLERATEEVRPRP